MDFARGEVIGRPTRIRRIEFLIFFFLVFRPDYDPDYGKFLRNPMLIKVRCVSDGVGDGEGVNLSIFVVVDIRSQLRSSGLCSKGPAVMSKILTVGLLRTRLASPYW